MWSRTTIILLLCVCAARANAPSGPDDEDNQETTRAAPAVHYSRKHLKALVRGAHTTEDHERLAGYFRARAAEFTAKAVQQEQAFAQYTRDPEKYAPKYPTRGDIEKELAAYYRGKAKQANALAYEQMREAEQIRASK
jgi:hypothetical protein